MANETEPIKSGIYIKNHALGFTFTSTLEHINI